MLIPLRDLNAVELSDGTADQLNINLYWPYVAYHCHAMSGFLHDSFDKHVHNLQL